MTQAEHRALDITDLERIARFKRAGYGGNVSDSLWELGVMDSGQPRRSRTTLAGSPRAAIPRSG